MRLPAGKIIPPPLVETPPNSYGPYAYCGLDKAVACTYHIHRELVQERGIECTNIPKIRVMWVQVGKHSQQMCP